MTRFSGGVGSKFDGNSILLHLDDLRYVYIGSEIYEFTAKEEITKYYSPIGNNDVPYPVAISKNYIYFMSGNQCGDLADYEAIENVDLTDAYTYYFGHHGGEDLSDKAEDFAVKLIHSRV